MSISTSLKSIIKKMPPIKGLIAERDALRLKLAQVAQAPSLNPVYSSLDKNKLEIIDFAFNFNKARSFADLGGVWGVNGGYTFYTLDKHNITEGVLVDTHPTEPMLERSKKYPQLRYIQGNFGDSQIAEQVRQVDAIFLFDVLLHQVSPNWDKILDLYAPQTKCLVILNQQWIGGGSTVRLLDLGEESYFENVPVTRAEGPYLSLFQKLDQKHPDHDRTWRDVHHIWQWGITDDDLEAKVESLGFRRQYYKNCGPFGYTKKFENHAFVFTK
jgi:hypothetical protein